MKRKKRPGSPINWAVISLVVNLFIDVTDAGFRFREAFGALPW